MKKYLAKDAHKLGTKELAKHLFPKEAIDKIKADLEKKPTLVKK